MRTGACSCVWLTAVLLYQLASAQQAVGGVLEGDDEPEDLAMTLHRLGFDAHHRQFITKLHDKGMLSFLSDKDLSAVG